MWALTATAEVTITDAAGLRQTAARANDGFVIPILGVADSEPDAPDADPADDTFDALARLI